VQFSDFPVEHCVPDVIRGNSQTRDTAAKAEEKKNKFNIHDFIKFYFHFVIIRAFSVITVKSFLLQEM